MVKRLGLIALLWALQAGAEVRTLTILHINDFHARLMPLDNKHGGAAYLAAAIQREKKDCTDCILLNAGDLAQGTPVSTMFRGMPIFEIANSFGIDAATLGNHDLDYGWEQTRRFMEASKYPMVSANMVDGNGALVTDKPYVILKVNGLRVGVVGAMTDTLPAQVFAAALGTWHATPVMQTVNRYAEELRSQCDLVVLLGHLTSDEEKAFLANPLTPVIVSGHAHNGLPKETSLGDHVMVRARASGEEIGRLELKIDTEKKAPVSWTWKKILVDSGQLVPEPSVAAQVKSWEDKVTALVDQPIGVSNRQLDKAAVKLLLEEAMKEVTGADLAYMNSSGVRDILPKGQILVRNAWNIMPFDNLVVYGTFKGKELPEIITKEHQIDPEREYRVAMPDFVASQSAKGLSFPSDRGYLRDALAELIRKRKTIE